MSPRAVIVVEAAVSAALRSASAGRGETILVALSGGADSVALLRALLSLQSRFGYGLAAAHLNHGIRFDEADRDECFARMLCARLGIELTLERAEGLVWRAANLKERARELRHTFLKRTADRIDASRIALAHHADDQAETVLLRLMRGSGVAGLGAMRQLGPGRLMRPMLALRRAQIVEYLAAIGATYVTDSSNFSTEPLRNRIRNQLIPMLEREYAPKLSRRLAGLASEMRAVADHLAVEAARELERRLNAPERLDLSGFSELDHALANEIMREWVRRCVGDLRRVHRQDIERMRELCLDDVSGGSVVLPRGWRLRREYGYAILEPARSPRKLAYELALACAGETCVEDAGAAIDAYTYETGDPQFPSCPWKPGTLLEALFDFELLAGRLMIRNFRPGDRVAPLGISGTRKLHDVFIDRKVSRERRARWPLVVAGAEILWVPGLVRSRKALVSSSTRKVLWLHARWREQR